MTLPLAVRRHGMMLAVLWAASWAVMASAMPAQAQTGAVSDAEVKAAYLYNFAKFVEWPQEAFADASSPLIIAVVDNEPFAELLAGTVAGKKVNNRSFQVIAVKRGTPLHGCHVLFVASNEHRLLSETLAQLRGTAVLSVGQDESFIRLGGMVNFFIEADRVRIEINPDRAAAARVRISSRLLALAKLNRTPGKE